MELRSMVLITGVRRLSLLVSIMGLLFAIYRLGGTERISQKTAESITYIMLWLVLLLSSMGSLLGS